MKRPSVLIVKGDNRGDQALTKLFSGFNSQFIFGPVTPKTLKWDWSLLAFKGLI